MRILGVLLLVASFQMPAAEPVGGEQAEILRNDRLLLFFNRLTSTERRAMELEAQGKVTAQEAQELRNGPIKDIGLTPAEEDIVRQYAAKMQAAVNKTDEEARKKLEPFLNPDPAKRPSGSWPDIAAMEHELTGVISKIRLEFEAALGQEGRRKFREHGSVISMPR